MNAIENLSKRLTSMNVINYTLAFLLLIFMVSFQQLSFACSMYKLTVGDKTIVGCNQDAWRTTTNIWYVNKTNENEYGACFTGSRRVGPNVFAPQSGMNEVGLVFSRLDAYHPAENFQKTTEKKIVDEVHYLTSILQNCKTVDEVKDYIAQFDRSVFNEEVFIYIDKSGAYLVVEPYKMIEGNEPSYLLANFCPSITNKEEARKQTKFKNGEDYLKKNELDASLDFCKRLSDTMSVCRTRNGDGTLLTSIWDTQNGLVNLYFYHNFDATIQFNIADELALGDHLVSIPDLFPKNPEFQRLIDYKTPFNQNALRILLAIIGGLICLLALTYIISFFKQRGKENFNFIKLIFAGVNLLLFYYLFVLTTNINVFYFDAPYFDANSILITLSSYIPFLLAVTIIPISYYNIQFQKNTGHGILVKSELLANNLIYVFLIIGFAYWGLFSVS